MKKKYYEAYDERYKVIHKHQLTWFSKNVTPELLEWVKVNKIPVGAEICEVGSGEGRDLFALASLGYKVTGIDISSEAIRCCNQRALEENFQNVELHQLDGTKINFPKKFKYIYSIATLHMLVLEEDRHNFLKSLYNLLEIDGLCLLVNMGDGKTQRHSDINDAFILDKRTHMETGQVFSVAGTSFCALRLEDHVKEIVESGFSVLESLITYNNEFGECMTMYLIKKNG